MPQSLLRKPDGFVPLASNIKLLDLAAKEWERPNLGLEWAQSLPKSMPNIGPIMFLARFFTNTEELIDAGLEYLSAQTNAFNIDLIREDKIARVIYKTNTFYWPGRQLIEHSIAGICIGVRTIANDQDIAPLEVHFAHSKPQTENYDKLLSAIFKCPVLFDCAEDELIYPIEILKTAPANNIGAFRSILRAHIQKRIEKLDSLQIRISDSVEQAILSLLGIRQVKFETVAELLDIAPKTLQRMLNSEGETFSNLLEKVRMASAKRMLSETKMTIEQIAKCLDYSSNPAFTLAFKRWEDLSPAQYRKAKKDIAKN